MWDNGRRNIKLDQAEFIDMGSLNEDSRFNTDTCTIKKLSKVCLNGWLMAFVKG